MYSVIADAECEVRISSSYDATKLWFNHNCEEFNESKQRYSYLHALFL